MEPITIPRDLHEKMIKTLWHEYEDEFGVMSEVRSYSRDELVQKYALNIAFWQKRQPDISTSRRLDMRTVCAHAIASNAISNMSVLNVQKHDENCSSGSTSSPYKRSARPPDI
jgi:hypothetical protein